MQYGEVSQESHRVYRYRCVVEYDGTYFAGWQRQEGCVTVQGEMEAAIRMYCGYAVPVFGAGRTDTGVHALGQVIHFDLRAERPCYQVQNAVNFHLRPHGVVLLHVERVAHDFHARFDAIQRVYEYRIMMRTAPLVLDRGRAWHIRKELDLDLMRLAAQSLIGTHDFSSFRSAHCSATSAIRTMDSIDIGRVEHDSHTILITLAARSFLHNQVRIIVGCLYQVGIGKYTTQDVAHLIVARDRTKGAATAPACGLYLKHVRYAR